jgi:hypothetical protein
MLRLVALRIKLSCKLVREPNLERTESQFGPPGSAPFSLKKRANSRFSLIAAPGCTKQSLKEVAAHETFAAFFRLNR